MDEYTRLYQLYLNKNNSELQEIMNPKNGYTEAAIKAATAIFQERGSEYQEESKEEIENIAPSSIIAHKKKKKTPTWFPVGAILLSFVIGAVLISAALNMSHSRNLEENYTSKIKEVETLQKELDYMQTQYNAKVKELDSAQKTIADLQKLLDDKQTQQNQNESVQPPQSSTDSLTVPEPTNTNYESSIKSATDKVFGSSNVESITYSADTNFALIKAKGHDNLTNKMIVQGMYKDIYDTLKELDEIEPLSLDFNITYSIVDIYGNSNNEIVIKASYSKETRNKLNFNNLLFENIDAVADDWWLHPALEAALK